MEGALPWNPSPGDLNKSTLHAAKTYLRSGMLLWVMYGTGALRPGLKVQGALASASTCEQLNCNQAYPTLLIRHVGHAHGD